MVFYYGSLSRLMYSLCSQLRNQDSYTITATKSQITYVICYVFCFYCDHPHPASPSQSHSSFLGCEGSNQKRTSARSEWGEASEPGPSAWASLGLLRAGRPGPLVLFTQSPPCTVASETSFWNLLLTNFSIGVPKDRGEERGAGHSEGAAQVSLVNLKFFGRLFVLKNTLEKKKILGNLPSTP